MSHCEVQDTPDGRCGRPAVLGVLVLSGTAPHEETSEWVAHACTEHAWEAVAVAAHRVGSLRANGHDDARVIALVEEAGEQLLGHLHQGITIGDRWPLAKPWATTGR